MPRFPPPWSIDETTLLHRSFALSVRFLKALLEAGRFDEIRGDKEVKGMVGDLLVSPVRKRVLGRSFWPN